MGSPCGSFWLAPLAASLLAFPGASVLADAGAAEQAADEKVFRFNVSPNGYPPYLITEDDQPAGIMWEVVSEITDRLGYSIEAVKVPRKRVDQMLLEGMIDGTSRARDWTDRPEEFLFTDAIVDIEEVVFFPADSSTDFHVPEDLYSLTLVTHLGYHYPALQPHFDSGDISRFDVPSDKDLFIYVSSGDGLDAAIADRLVGQWLLLKQDMQHEFRVSSSSVSRSGLRLMLRPDWQSFAKAFNKELAAMRKNGEVETILSRYR